MRRELVTKLLQKRLQAFMRNADILYIGKNKEALRGSMSLTVTIKNNEEYVDQNCPDKILVTVEEADPIYFPKGHTFKQYHYEMNLSNGNFTKLIAMLGVEFDYTGSLSPNLVLSMLKNKKPSCFMEEGNLTDGMWSDCGITLDQSSRYYFSLLQMANEAKRRNECLVWF